MLSFAVCILSCTRDNTTRGDGEDGEGREGERERERGGGEETHCFPHHTYTEAHSPHWPITCKQHTPVACVHLPHAQCTTECNHVSASHAWYLDTHYNALYYTMDSILSECHTA